MNIKNLTTSAKYPAITMTRKTLIAFVYETADGKIIRHIGAVETVANLIAADKYLSRVRLTGVDSRLWVATGLGRWTPVQADIYAAYLLLEMVHTMRGSRHLYDKIIVSACPDPIAEANAILESISEFVTTA